MGVHSLSTYVRNKGLLRDHQLTDTKLIIDGENLCHKLYYADNIPTEYGGDYDVFRDKCQAFFTELTECNVKPYVLLDGAQLDNSKLKTIKERAQQRIDKCFRISDGASGGDTALLPILATEVFRFTLRRLDIPFTTCDFEADDEIAALALEWDCPVLTDDSDFFIYNIPAGVITIDHLIDGIKERAEGGKAETHIKCKIFRWPIPNFVDQSMAPLLATLLGNDIFPPENFGKQFYKISLQLYGGKANGAAEKVTQAVDWLAKVEQERLALEKDASTGRSFGRVEYALERILDKVQPYMEFDKEMIRSLIHKSMDQYGDKKTYTGEYFDKMSQQATEVSATSSPEEVEGELPGWFRSLQREGKIPSAVLDVLSVKRLCLPRTVEKRGEPSPNVHAVDLRQATYAIALSLRTLTYKTVSGIAVVEYDRDGNYLSESQVLAAFPRSWDDKDIRRFRQMPQIDVEKRFDLLMSAVCAPAGIGDLPRPVQLMISAVHYWRMKVGKRHKKQKKQTSDESYLVQSVLLCMAHLGAFGEPHQFAFDNSCKPARTQETFATVHRFSEFQTCLLAANNLAKVLNLHEILTDPAVVFSGSTAYKIFVSIERDPDSFESMIYDEPTTETCRIYQRAYAAVYDLAGSAP